MISKLKSYFKDALRTCGLDVRFAANHDALQIQARLLQGTPVHTVIDGGAYHGEWTQNYRRTFPDAQIFQFEPFPDSQTRLAELFANDRRTHLVNSALGNKREQRLLHTNNLAATNSLLRVDERVASQLPDPNWVTSAGSLKVDVIDLDAYCREQKLSHVNVLKLDIQGNELAALQGAGDLLAREAVDVIYTELLFLPHYQGQAYHFEICDYLHRMKYGLFGLYNLGVLRSGQMLQADGVFIAPRIQDQLREMPPNHGNEPRR